ncbi:methyltransferase domain-containing protein [Micromonospora sp. NPDC048909]|uniref:class I SAM-dependent DNA methyltransferase n=1 Tax=Micromonospora sp. NPDC048909 TaxID=3155643 RepID=UPI0033F91FC0
MEQHAEQYAEGFAQAYDEHWSPYPTRAAEQLLRLHRTLDPEGERRLLDIGCGTGIVAAQLQQAGYQVTGLDVSAAMLRRARRRLGDDAVLVQADAADFTVPEPFPLAISTYDIPNHLGSLERIGSYLECVYRALRPGGLFAFDVATRKGLLGVNAMQIRETDESILLYRGALNEAAGYGFYRISGVVRAADGRYDRFETTITNYLVPLDQLADTLKQVGWRDTYLAAPTDLLTPLTDAPIVGGEQLPRVYFVSRR